MSLSRRELIVGAAAVGCVGCSAVDGLADDVLGEPQIAGFGSKINVGTVDEVLQNIRDNDGFWYLPEGRAWFTEYPADSLERARNVYSFSELTAMEAGFVALFQKCPHLGCRVPSCATSQWFECPCHGSKYNQVGEKRGGPAPRGMDRFAVSITDDNEVIVNTAAIIQGPEIGTNTTGQEAAGPKCIGEAEN